MGLLFYANSFDLTGNKKCNIMKMIIVINKMQLKTRRMMAMSVLLIGADRLGNIPHFLESKGIHEYTHWDGRKKGMRNMKVPEDTDMIIVFTDFIEHRLTEMIKESAKEMNIPCIYSRRAVSDLAMKLDACVGCGRCKLKA